MTTSIPRAMASPYMEWAKLSSGARYNLATSGMAAYPLAQLPVQLRDIEINGPTVYGFEPLLERLARKHGVGIERVVTANGTAMANHLAMAATFEPGDEVLIERPAYGPLVDLASYLQARIVRFERRVEQNFQVDPDEVRRQLTPRTRLIVLSNLHNPSGAYTAPETLVQVGALAAQVGARVLVDEVYLDMVEPAVGSACHLGEHFLVTASLTKAYGLSGLRCGWIIASAELSQRIWRLNDLFGATAVHPSELLSVIALDHLEEIGARARSLLARNRQALDHFFEARPEVAGFQSRWGTVTFPALRHGSVEEFCQRLKVEHETSVVPGRFFEMPGHFRIGIGGDAQMTAEGLTRLGKALKVLGA